MPMITLTDSAGTSFGFNPDNIIYVGPQTGPGGINSVLVLVGTSPSAQVTFPIQQTVSSVINSINALKQPVSLSGTVTETVTLQGG